MERDNIQKHIGEINEELKKLDFIYENNPTYEGYPEWESDIIELQMEREILYSILDDLEME